jgi:hypothetical protein
MILSVTLVVVFDFDLFLSFLTVVADVDSLSKEEMSDVSDVMSCDVM